jgi:hypothetical protein
MTYAVELSSVDMIYLLYVAAIRSDIRVILRLLRQKIEMLKFWHYWVYGSVNYAV